MKKWKYASLAVSIIIISFFSIFPASGATPFVVDYPYGIQQADDPTLAAKYTSWASWFVTSSGANGYMRIRYPEGLACAGVDATSSQGLGYAMLLASWFGDQPLFNNLWNYKKTVSPRLGLMASCVDSGGIVIDQNSATDADADIAMALVHAHRRWGSGGALNYGALATTEINKVASSDVCASSSNLYPGDYCSCTSNDNTYPSYFTPAWYPIFGEHTGNTSFWNSVKTKAYSMLASSRNANGLDTEQITYGGAAVSNLDGYNSARIPWRYSLDYVWTGDANSLNQITRDWGFFTGKSGSACAVYEINGTCSDAAYSGHRIGPAGTSMMIAGKAAELDLYYNAATAAFDNTAGSNYYDSTMALLALLQMTGNCPKVFGPTPSPPCCIGPCGCGDVFEDAEDGDDQNNWGGMWYTYYDRGPINYGTSYVVPCPVSFYTQAGLTPVPFYMQAPGLVLTPGNTSAYAARMTGNVTTAFTYGFIGMGTGTNQNSGRMTFTPKDCSMYTGIEFLVKASNNTDKYDFVVMCPESVTNTGDNDYKFTFTPLTYTIHAVIPFSTLTQAVGWGNPVSLPLVLQNLTDLRWQTNLNGQPKANVDLWVDNIGFYPAKPPTATPTYCAGEKFDGLEDNDGINLFGGAWYTYESVSSTVYPVAGSAFTASAPGANASLFAARMFGTIGNQAGEYAGMGSDLKADGTARNMSAFVGVSFWVKGDGSWYSIKLKAGPSVNTGNNDWKHTFKPPTGSWAQMTLPFAVFTQEGGWGLTVPLPTILTNLKEVRFESKGINHSMDLWVDDIVFNCSQYWTPTITPTRTQTLTPLPSYTFTATPSGTIVLSPTDTDTPLPSFTETPTQEDTVVIPATETETPEPATATPEATATDTAQPAPTGTHSAAATLTPAPAFTATATATADYSRLAIQSVVSFPNPSDGSAVTFRYVHSGLADTAKLMIFTFDGRKIAEINGASQEPGASEIIWKIRHRVGNGMYYYALELSGKPGKTKKTGMFVILNK